MEHSPDIVNTMTASDEAHKIATVLNSPLQFKIPVYVLNRNRSAHDNIIIKAFDVTGKEGSDGRDSQVCL